MPSFSFFLLTGVKYVLKLLYIDIKKGIDSTLFAEDIILAGRQDNFCLICDAVNSENNRITIHRTR